jgi:spore maturation protein CgeB
MHDDPYELDVSLSIVELADFIFTTDKASQIHYPPNIPSFHLPLAACPYTHVRSITQRTGPEWFFCGVPFPCRTFFFTQVQKHGLDKKGLLLGPQWNLEKINSAADIPVSSGQIANYYSTARSVIYLGRDTDLANERFKVKPSTPGPRLFEAAMAGACQIALTPGLEIAEYFELESELILIDGVNDFSLVLSQLEVEPSLSEKIGKAAQERALKSHTYKHRALELIKQFEEAIV